MAHEDDRPLERIYQLAIRTKLSHKAVCKRQYSISGCLARRGESFGVVVVNKDSDVVSLMREQVAEPQDARLCVRPCLESSLEDTMDSNDTTILN